MIRRSVARQIGGRDPGFRQASGFDLWLRATRLGRMIRIPRTLAYRRPHGANESNADGGRERAGERIRLIEKTLSDPAEPHWSDADRRRALAAAYLAAAAIAGRSDRHAALGYLA